MENIRDLIAAGRLEEALDLLVSSNPDAILLKSRYANGKRQYTMGLVDFSEWQRVQNQVAYAALELAGNGNHSTSAPPANTPKTPTQSATKKVFISYNHGDADTAVKLRDALQEAGFEVIIDRDDMPPGMDILEFIQQSIRNADVVLSVVSAKSLESGWVGQESVASFYAIWLADKRFIPVRLDDVVFNIDFQIDAQEKLNEKTKELDVKLERLRNAGGNTVAFEKTRQRMFELKSNLGGIIDRLNSVLILDVREPSLKDSMNKIIQSLKSN
ncbi:MAG: TIR domain-containing protein [Saprospiraceae bacterium]